MAQVKGLSALVHEVKKRAFAMKKNSNTKVSVGYSAPYSLYVHEDLTKQHKPPTGAKFLENVLRNETIMRRVRDEVTKRLLRDDTFNSAMGSAASIVLEESQKLCPVKTGALKNSAFIELS